MVFVRYCEQGEIQSRFVSLEPEEKDNAVNITAAIEQACQMHLKFAGDDFKSKLVGFGSDGPALAAMVLLRQRWSCFGSDGAAVMQGRGHWNAPEEAALVTVNCGIVTGYCDCFIPKTNRGQTPVRKSTRSAEC